MTIIISDQAVNIALNTWFGGIPAWRNDATERLRTEMRAALTAAAPHLAAVRVKKLEWGNARITEDGREAEDAESPVGRYIATDTGWFLLGQTGYKVERGLYQAKAAAQADYSARILSALEPSGCKTCNGHGIIGGMYRVGDGDVDGWEKPCPDCEPSPQAQSSELSRRLEEFLKENEDCFFDCEIQTVKDAISALASHPVADKPDEAGAQGEVKERIEFQRGYVLACANIVNLHGPDVNVAEGFAQLNISRDDLKRLDLCDYDQNAIHALEDFWGLEKLYVPSAPASEGAE
ncbi:hypothetical protein FHW20_002182 [Ochrobactrum intermedium]|uniref:Uncharacterized protein n=1 Tax=Brucella intermedia TaxID=94625 RepID=A0ABR6AP73_9HYPH|nr:hypothetical protein [Brucella intermedia]MBA8851247.1 hypothetical protein [Brucella intermedia]